MASSGRLLMYIKNSMGPRTVLCGTSERTGWEEDCDPSETTLCDLPCRTFWIQVCVVPLMPYQLSLYRRRLCGTLSKALLKSMMIRSVCEGLLDRSWKRERSWMSHENFFWKPCWGAYRIWFKSWCCMILLTCVPCSNCVHICLPSFHPLMLVEVPWLYYDPLGVTMLLWECYDIVFSIWSHNFTM